MALFSFGLAFSVMQVLGMPAALKQALAQSGIYDVAASNWLHQAQQSAEGSSNTIPIDQPAVADVVNKAFPASSIQPQAEKAIDNMYDWLHGKTPTLRFSIDLQGNQSALVSNLTDYVKQHAAALPTCPAGSPAVNVDPFQATCLPAGITPDMVAQQAESQINQNNFAKQANVNANTPDASGQTAAQRLSKVPNIYNAVQKSIYLTGVLALTCLLGVIFLSRPWRTGIRRVSISGLVIGGLGALFAWLSVYATGKLASFVTNSAGGTNTFQTSIADIVHTLAADIRAWWLGYSIGLIVLGVIGLLSLKYLHMREAAKPPEHDVHVVTN